MVRIYVSQDHPVQDLMMQLFGLILMVGCILGFGALADEIFHDDTIDWIVALVCGVPAYFGLLNLFFKLGDKIREAEYSDKKSTPSTQYTPSKQIKEEPVRVSKAPVSPLENESFYNDIFHMALKKSHVTARVGAAALIDIPVDDDPESIMTRVSIAGMKTTAISGYIGDLDYVEELRKNPNLFSSIKVTAQDWFKYYLSKGLDADESTEFFIVWNHRGDIIGIVAYWSNGTGYETAFLPRGISKDVIATVPSDPNRSSYGFGHLLNPKVHYEWHPYRYEEDDYGMIELKELIGGKWVKTGWFDLELAAMRPEKGVATLMTIPVLLEVDRIRTGRAWINEQDKK